MNAALASVCCVCGCAVDLHAPHAILKHDYAHLDCADVYDSRDLGMNARPSLWPSPEVWERARQKHEELKQIIRDMNAPIGDPSTNAAVTQRGPDGPDASDPDATVSTPPGAGCAESRSVEGSSMDVYPQWRVEELGRKYACDYDAPDFEESDA